MSNKFLAVTQELADYLATNAYTLAVAESCTGGGVGYALTSLSGSSSWFHGGFITYSNQAKQDMLQISAALLEKYGAVSNDVAEAMAAGVLLVSKASCSLSVTGIAGPDGGSDDKPVGMVCFAWACREKPIVTETMQFFGDRASIREQSVHFALSGLLRYLQAT